MDQPNAMRRSLESDDHLLGALAMTLSPKIIETYASLGLDFVWLDLEHDGYSPYDSPTLVNLVRTASAADISLLVRIPSGNPPEIRKVLDAGIRNVIVPRVESAAEVRRAVRASRFEFDDGIGDRGVAASRLSDWGASLGPEYTRTEDENVLLGVMIENRSAVAALDEILSVPSLGFVFIGPGDLSVSLGHPMETDHPDVQEMVTAIRDSCVSAGVPVGRISSDPSTTLQAIDNGYRMIRIGDEVSAAREVLGNHIDTVIG